MSKYKCSTCMKEYKSERYYNQHITIKKCVNKDNILEKIVVAPKNEPKIEPIIKPKIEPITKLIIESITEPKIEPITEPIIEPITKLIIESIIESITEPIIKIDKDILYEKPIIKWVGGKTQIIDKVIDNFPTEMDNYHELFLGGGSVLIALLQNVKNKRILINGSINAYDINETLINMYKNIQKKATKVLLEIKKLINIYNNIEGVVINRKPKNIQESKTSQESYYYWLRQQFNKLSQEEKNTPLGTAYFIFLNKTCFRGVYREGPSGFNVPFGHYLNPEIINEEHIKTISLLIKDVNFRCMSFERSFEKVHKNDFIYLDPPYAPENDKSFVGYTANGFDLVQHNLLFDLCKKHKFLMSNADVELVKNSFKDKQFTIKIISCKRSINSKKPNSKTNEVLIKTN